MTRLTYKSAGVDIASANRFVKAIQSDVAKTRSEAVLHRPGSFGSLFALDKKYKNPVLVSSTDGVGTKLLIAQSCDIHDTVGIDLVAMNVNDVLCTGARPLFFLDYIACGKLKPVVLKDVVKGIAKGCREAGCSLIGGETAEMPGMYHPDEYDLAGFAVGVVERNKIIDGSGIKAGDLAIGLPSSGLHSNGYSLVRRVFTKAEQKVLADDLLVPTRIYVKEVLPVLERFKINAIAHITGGAFYDKLTKVLPKGKCFVINRGSWPVPLIFQNIQKRGKVSDYEMFRTFNMGIGLVLVASPKDFKGLQRFLNQRKIKFFCIGKVANHPRTKILF